MVRKDGNEGDDAEKESGDMEKTISTQALFQG